MSAEPFDIAIIIEQLKAKVTALKTVDGAAEYAAITNLRGYVTPSAYVILVREEPDPESPKNGQQRCIATFGVVIAVRNYRGKTGGEVASDASPIIGAVRVALMGYVPPLQGARAVKWMGGDVIDYDNNTLLWGDVFQTQYFMGP